MPVLESEVFVPRPREEVFAFFTDPVNLERLMPPEMPVRTLPPRGTMRERSIVGYVLRIRGIPLPWVGRVEEHDAPRRFVDVQVVGPYLSWRHEHAFEEVAGGTLVKDRVTYRHLGGRLLERRLVRPDLERVFAYRREVLPSLFPRPRQLRGS